MVSSERNGYILELIAPPVAMEKIIRADDGIYDRIPIDGWARTDMPGAPELPITGTLLKASAEGEIRLTVIHEVYESFAGCMLYPVPRLRIDDYGEKISEFYRDETIYGSAGFFPGQLVKIVERGWLRDEPVIHLRFFPFQWNTLTKELRRYSSIRVMVSFESPPGIDNAFRYSPAPAIKERLSLTTINEGIYIEIKRDGVYRYTFRDSDIPFPFMPDPQALKLTTQGRDIPLKFICGSINTIVPGDAVEFYATAFDSVYSDASLYWLSCDGTSAGKRISSINGEVTGAARKITSFWYSLHSEENHKIWESMPGAVTHDYWFWERITAPFTSHYSLHLPSLDPNQHEATIRVCFRGRSTAQPHPNHHTIISLNGYQIGEGLWDGEIEYLQEMGISSTLLVTGNNTITIKSPGDTGASVDIVYLNWIEVSYQRLFEAIDNTLTFTVDGNSPLQIEIRNFTRPAIRIFDITELTEVKEVTAIAVQPSGTGYIASFENQIIGERTYHAFTTDTIASPENTLLWRSADLGNPLNGADYIVITAREFLSSVEPLCQFRRNQGLRVMAVAIEDIYNEFNYGIENPSALKDFLSYAYESWMPPAPTYVLLAGDSNTDFKDYLGTGKKNIIPVHLSITDLGLTPDDNWYACVAGNDVLPDLLIGRIPGSGPEMVNGIVNKIVGFETAQTSFPQHILFAADNGDHEFEAINDRLAGYLPEGFTEHRVYLNLYPDVNHATQDIFSNINLGSLITNYVGHGSVNNWAGEMLFQSSCIPNLSNSDYLTFVISMTCLNGYFSQPVNYCLAEEFIAAPGKGAIACFSPSGLGYVWEHDILDNALFSMIFDEGRDNFGFIAARAKIAAYTRGITKETLSTFTLFGDPAGRLKIERGIPCSETELFDGMDNNCNGIVDEGCHQTIPLRSGWNLISYQALRCFYEGNMPALNLITPDTNTRYTTNTDMTKILFEKKESLLEWLLDPFNSPIRDAADPNLAGNWRRIISFDEKGAHLIDKTLPAFINTLHYLSFGYGYWIKMNEPGFLSIKGQADVSGREFNLASGWNLIGIDKPTQCYAAHTKTEEDICPFKPQEGFYRAEEGISICLLDRFPNTVFTEIEGKYRRIITFDSCNGGMLYDTTIPSFINTLYYLGPKYGVWVKMLEDARFTFPGDCPGHE